MNFDSSVLNIAIEDILPNRFQPRLNFNDGGLEDLANSIKEHGIIQPLVLRRMGDKYEIIAGERRYKAATMAGLTSVPAVIANIDDKKSAEISVVENVQREELSAIEEAKSYKALLDQGFMSEEQLSKKIGIPLDVLQSKLKLLNLHPDVQDAITTKKISERHGRSLLSIEKEEDQKKLLEAIINERLTVKQLNDKINLEYKVHEKPKPKKVASSNPATIPIQRSSTSMGIELGETRKNKFFNALEDESANMVMTDAINPLFTFNTTTAEESKIEPLKNLSEIDNIFSSAPSVSKEPKIEVLDTLSDDNSSDLVDTEIDTL
ncbi:MAG: ParB/RepB/Spo0J family partition protein [Mollicutes bacterium]|nr:ParB/RepB/Spo0J family partition protein [Mollicutes bacterium]